MDHAEHTCSSWPGPSALPSLLYAAERGLIRARGKGSNCRNQSMKGCSHNVGHGILREQVAKNMRCTTQEMQGWEVTNVGHAHNSVVKLQSKLPCSSNATTHPCCLVMQQLPSVLQVFSPPEVILTCRLQLHCPVLPNSPGLMVSLLPNPHTVVGCALQCTAQIERCNVRFAHLLICLGLTPNRTSGARRKDWWCPRAGEWW